MSQAKVDRYKKEKENRKKLMRKQKIDGNRTKGSCCSDCSGTDWLVGIFSI